MSENIHFTARQVMDEWEIDPVDLYHELQNGLPAEYPSPLGWRKLEVHWLNPFDHDFEKRICLLRFWKRHVELWEKGGREALDEGKRLRFPSMGDSPDHQLPTAPSDPLPAKKELLPCEPGTMWRDITITKVADEMVRIKTPEGKGLFTYQHLGLEDGRSPDKPTKLWDLLVALAERSGLIHSENYSFDRTLPSTAKRLNKHLQKKFGIEDSIYADNYKKEGAYRTKIIFEDETF